MISAEQQEFLDRFGVARVLLREHRFDEAAGLLEGMTPTELQALLGLKGGEALGYNFAARGNFSRAALLSDLGTTLVFSGHYAESISVLARSMSHGYASPSALNAMGIAYRNLGDYGSALDAFQAASERAPDRYEIWSNMGVLNMEQGSYQKADNAFYQAAEAFHQTPQRVALDETVLINNVKAFQNQVIGWVQFPDAQKASLELWYDEGREDADE